MRTEGEKVIDCEIFIGYVFRMIEIIKSLGAQVDWLGERKIKIQVKEIEFVK